MVHLTDQQLKDINDSFPWQTGIALPDGRILGNKDKMKDSWSTINLLTKYCIDIALTKKTCLEVGCAEGFNTVKLATVFNHVWSTDVRPRNLIMAQIRKWVLQLNNIEFILLDLNHAKYNEFIAFDFVYHTGVLYHLINPIEHLQYIASITNRLFLSTRCYDEDSKIKLFDQVNPPYKYSIGNGTVRFRQYRINEKQNNWSKSFAGIEPYSIWLHKDDIANILEYVGFTSVTKLVESKSYCPKVVYIATK